MSDELRRIEDKVDKLTDAVTRLILVEDRQTVQGSRINALEQQHVGLQSSILQVDRKVDKWVNMGFGAWALAVTLFAVVQVVLK
jgi:hypothetical protein